MDLRELADCISAADHQQQQQQMAQQKEERQQEEEENDEEPQSMGLVQSAVGKCGAKQKKQQQQLNNANAPIKEEKSSGPTESRPQQQPKPQPRRRHSLCPLRSLLPNQRPSNSPPTSPPLPTSPAATLLVAGWRRELAKPSSPESATESSSSHSGCGGGTSLSELSQEVLAQLIRLFPFPAPSPQSPPQRPKLCRALSQPATSIDYSTPSCSATVDETVVACSSTAIASKVAAERSQCSAETYVTVSADRLCVPPSPSLSSREWHNKASASLGKLRRAASNLSACAGVAQKRERPKQLPLVGGGDGPSKTTINKNGALGRLCRVSWLLKIL